MQRHAAIRVEVGLVLASLFGFRANPQTVEEYQVKAAYLYNFAKFVEWPPQSFASSNAPIVICILGEDPFGGSVQELLRGKTAAGRAVVVRPVADLPGAKGCHMLFVGSGTWRYSRPALRSVSGDGLLTVGEAPGFTAGGGMINFKLDAGRVRFEINVEAARQAHLQISSKLLSLAEIVRTRE